MNCHACGRTLTRDEIAITRKMVNRGSEVFWCADCLAADFKMPVTEIFALMERFRAAGCSLFDPQPSAKTTSPSAKTAEGLTNTENTV